MSLETQTLGGRYLLEKLIGSGAMGDVYRARDLTLERDVAVKVLTGGDAPTRARFMGEARTMALLNHPNIVGIYDFGAVGELSYFVMEYVDGLMLKSAQATLRPTFAQLVGIFVDVFDALGFAHGRSVVHRDVKPGNILVTPSFGVKVSDFGLSRRMSDVTSSGTPGEIVGTIAYLPPESFLGKPTDLRGDLYSAGIVMYEAFTGALPFTSRTDDVVAVVFAHVNDAPIPPRALNRALPAALEHLILRLIEKNPEQRYRQAADVAKDLRAIADVPVSASFADASAQATVPAPAASEAVDPGIRSMLDRMLSPQRAMKEALGRVVGAMLAVGRRDYVEAAALYRAAIDDFRFLKNQPEQIKATMHFAECMVTSSLDHQHTYDRASLRKALELVNEAIPLARERGMRRELDRCERLVHLLEDAELRRR